MRKARNLQSFMSVSLDLGKLDHLGKLEQEQTSGKLKCKAKSRSLVYTDLQVENSPHSSNVTYGLK